MNKLPGLRFTKPGFLTLLQDGGRQGVMHMGLAAGGAMDRHAWAWANHLLGNRYGAAGLEITFGGIEFVCDLDTQIALTGAEARLTVNGEPRPLWATVTVRAGDTIALSPPTSGVRNYLAVLGGFVADAGPGDSCATIVREGTGGLHRNGQAVAQNDVMPCRPGLRFVPSRKIPDVWIPDYRADLYLQVIPCAQIDRFGAEALNTFFSNPYTLTPQADRMGARLRGPALNVSGKSLLSEGTSLGAIQVPTDGQPIILLNDRQTIGGYPKLGAVTPRSLDALAQRTPGSRLHFQPVPLHAAQLQERHFLMFFRASTTDLPNRRYL